MKHKTGCNINFGDKIYLADKNGVVELPKEYKHLNPVKENDSESKTVTKTSKTGTKKSSQRKSRTSKLSEE